jgi:hypothetical protein
MTFPIPKSRNRPSNKRERLTDVVVVSSIFSRERTLKALVEFVKKDLSHHSSKSGGTMCKALTALIYNFRNETAVAIEAINEWNKTLLHVAPMMWRGENYMDKILYRDPLSLANSTLTKALSLSVEQFRDNPFLLHANIHTWDATLTLEDLRERNRMPNTEENSILVDKIVKAMVLVLQSLAGVSKQGVELETIAPAQKHKKMAPNIDVGVSCTGSTPLVSPPSSSSSKRGKPLTPIQKYKMTNGASLPKQLASSPYLSPASRRGYSRKYLTPFSPESVSSVYLMRDPVMSSDERGEEVTEFGDEITTTASIFEGDRAMFIRQFANKFATQLLYTVLWEAGVSLHVKELSRRELVEQRHRERRRSNARRGTCDSEEKGIQQGSRSSKSKREEVEKLHRERRRRRQKQSAVDAEDDGDNSTSTATRLPSRQQRVEEMHRRRRQNKSSAIAGSDKGDEPLTAVRDGESSPAPSPSRMQRVEEMHRKRRKARSTKSEVGGSDDATVYNDIDHSFSSPSSRRLKVEEMHRARRRGGRAKTPVGDDQCIDEQYSEVESPSLRRGRVEETARRRRLNNKLASKQKEAELSQLQNDSAIKIQSLARGRRDRKAVKVKREDKRQVQLEEAERVERERERERETKRVMEDMEIQLMKQKDLKNQEMERLLQLQVEMEAKAAKELLENEERERNERKLREEREKELHDRQEKDRLEREEKERKEQIAKEEAERREREELEMKEKEEKRLKDLEEAERARIEAELEAYNKLPPIDKKRLQYQNKTDVRYYKPVSSVIPKPHKASYRLLSSVTAMDRTTGGPKFDVTLTAAERSAITPQIVPQLSKPYQVRKRPQLIVGKVFPQEIYTPSEEDVRNMALFLGVDYDLDWKVRDILESACMATIPKTCMWVPYCSESGYVFLVSPDGKKATWDLPSDGYFYKMIREEIPDIDKRNHKTDSLLYSKRVAEFSKENLIAEFTPNDVVSSPTSGGEMEAINKPKEKTKPSFFKFGG